MARATYYCRGCAKFVAGPLANCGSCGTEHQRDYRASEEPPRLRNRRSTRNDGWDSLFPRRKRC